MVRNIAFDKVHVASYSTRPGTIASRKLVDDLPWEEKKRRQQAIEDLQQETQTRINARLLSTVTDVLVEGKERGKWKGRNRNDKLVFIEDQRDLRGQMVQVRIEKTSPWSLQGAVV